MSTPTDPELLRRAGRIRLLSLDVDGVLTDGRLHYGPEGEDRKVFHVRDGHGIKAALQAGIEIVVISGRRSDAVSRRMAELGVPRVFQGVGEKRPVFEALLTELDIAPEHSAHIGDDTPDLPVFAVAGLGIGVADAHPEVRAAAQWCTTLPGGHGAVREVCDLLLRARGPDLPHTAG